MATTASKFEDLGDITDLYHHKLRNVSAYLYSCGFERGKKLNYRDSRIFVDHTKNRGIKLYINETTDVVERVQLLHDVQGI